MKVLLAGASGLIGTAVHRMLLAQGHIVHQLKRAPEPEPQAPYRWSPQRGYIHPEPLQWADVVISLSGAPLTRLPWRSSYRQKIRQSRVDSTKTLAQGIAASADPPQAWISGSAVGFYGSRPQEELDESSTQGRGFLADVVASWEQATHVADQTTRVVHARTGIVVADGGAFAPLTHLTTWGLGGKLGSGEQYWPWISLFDEAAALVHLATRSELRGPVNLVGPQPASVAQITRTLANLRQRPYWAHVPAGVLRLVLGGAADDLLLADQRVKPQALLDDHFIFRYPTITHALDALGTHT